LLYAPVRRLTVDACAAQHPGVPSPLRPERTNAAMQWNVSRSEDFVWLDPPVSLGEITIRWWEDR
jgi:hypothetical protein